jgi:hypothetical protein
VSDVRNPDLGFGGVNRNVVALRKFQTFDFDNFVDKRVNVVLAQVVNIITPVGRSLLFTPLCHAPGRNASKVAHVDIKALMKGCEGTRLASLDDPSGSRV